MEDKPYIEFKKRRDLGAIITDTFRFLRVEWKPFFTTVFKIALLPILLAIAGAIYYSYEQSNLYAHIDLENTENTLRNSFGGGGNLIVATLIFLLSYLIVYIVINVVSMYYIKSYITHKGTVNYQEIKQNVKENIWQFTGLGILTALIMSIGMLFCLFPGVYFFVPLSLATSIYIFKGKTVMDTIGYSFEFIKGYWWETFGVFIVIMILVAVLGNIFSVPAFIYTIITAVIGVSENDPTIITSILSNPFYTFLTIISYLGKFLFYSVSLIATVFIYFDINEQKFATGTLEKIDTLGQK